MLSAATHGGATLTIVGLNGNTWAQTLLHCAISRRIDYLNCRANKWRILRMKFAAALAATISLALLSGCGSSGATSVIQPVQAQSGYSNASVTGTYSVYLSEGTSETLIGSFAADGNGKITSGSLAENNGPGNCTMSITGTYNITSSASGTATIASASAGLVGCPGSGNSTTSLPFSIQVGQQGASIVFAGSGNLMFSGSATKQ